MQASINRTGLAGSRIGADNSTMANNIVGMQQGEIEAKAAANVIKTGDEILGTIINVRG